MDHSAVSSVALEEDRLRKAGMHVVNVTTQWRQTVLFKKGTIKSVLGLSKALFSIDTLLL
jgi:hypothetical protein